ncbi:MAG: hypothetical protein K0S07_1581 [Chlamydiales bacterium]|jgi:hypothetical protein|nr:hypothetical protein [Chlamydiales bacterium]
MIKSVPFPKEADARSKARLARAVPFLGGLFFYERSGKAFFRLLKDRQKAKL